MVQSLFKLSTTQGTVTEVMPLFGLAYISGDDARDWTVTKSTPGAGLHALRPGTRLSLEVSRNDEFSVVSGYAPLDWATGFAEQASYAVANITVTATAISAVADQPNKGADPKSSGRPWCAWAGYSTSWRPWWAPGMTLLTMALHTSAMMEKLRP